MRALIALLSAVVLLAVDAPSEPACPDLIGSTWEIRSLEGLPASADRMIGEKDGAAPRRPNLIFGTDRGTWTRADGQKESFGYLCDERGLTITLSGKPLRMEREPGGFRYAGAPVRRFTPKAPALTCENLPGKTFEIGTTGLPKSTLGKNGFASDLEPVATAPPGPRAPWIKFAGLTVEWVTLDGPRVSVLYECDEKGVRVEHEHQRLLMPWHEDGLMWFGSPARPYAAPK